MRQVSSVHNYDKLQLWSYTWLMKFNITKCKVMQIRHIERRPRFDYHIVRENYRNLQEKRN